MGGEKGAFSTAGFFPNPLTYAILFFSFPLLRSVGKQLRWEETTQSAAAAFVDPSVCAFSSFFHCAPFFPFLLRIADKKYIYGVFLLALNLRSVLIIKRTYKRFQSRRRRCRCHPGYLTLDLIREAEKGRGDKESPFPKTAKIFRPALP